MRPAASVLDPTPEPLWLGFVASVAGHGCLLVAMLLYGLLSGVLGACFQGCSVKKPLIDPDQTIEAVVIVKKSDRLPTQEVHRPRPQGAEVAPSPEPSPAPPPPVESDLVVHQKVPDPKPTSGDPKAEAARQAALDQLRQLEALEGLSDMERSSPEGTGDVNIGEGRPSGIGDPEYARYINELKELFDSKFAPIESRIAGKNLKAVIHVRVADDGTVTERTMVQSSGDAYFDATALAAARAVSKIPLPPEKYRWKMAEGYSLPFARP